MEEKKRKRLLKEKEEEERQKQKEKEKRQKKQVEAESEEEKHDEEQKDEEEENENRKNTKKRTKRNTRCAYHMLIHDKCPEDCIGREELPKKLPAPWKATFDTKIQERRKENKQVTEKERVEIAVTVYKEMMEEKKEDLTLGWGTILIDPAHKAWNDKSMIWKVTKFMASPGFSYWLNPGSYFEKTGNPMEEWLQEWKELSPDMTPFLCTLTASDAINLLPSVIAQYHGKKNIHNMLVFNKNFGAARGNLASLSAIENNREFGIEVNNEYRISTPCTRINTLEITEKEWPAGELQQLKRKEKESLKEIREKLEKDNTIGAIMIDIIIITDGVQFFRKQYLQQLYTLTREHNILLIADETLTALRTGARWAYSHFLDVGFDVDFTVFGKGLITAGLAANKAHTKNFSFTKWDQTTVQANAIDLIRSTVVLSVIREEKLLQKSKEMGQFLIQEFRKKDQQLKKRKEDFTTGIGNLIYTTLSISYKTARTRLLPPLTYTIEEATKLVDAVIMEAENIQTCFLCGDGGELILCDGYKCFKGFHKQCAGLEELPPDEEKWYCKYCQHHHNTTQTKNRSKSSPQTKKRLTRKKDINNNNEDSSADE